MKFMAKYDQNKLIGKVFQLLTIITEVGSRERLANDFDFKASLEGMTVNHLDDIKVRKINEILRGDKRLNVYTIAETNPIMSTLFAFLQLLLKRFMIIF
jgi:hypothetical protein